MELRRVPLAHFAVRYTIPMDRNGTQPSDILETLTRHAEDPSDVPWGHQQAQGESLDAYEAFQRWIEHEGKAPSLTALADDLGCSASTLYGYSRRFRWKARRTAWLRHKAAIMEEEMADMAQVVAGAWSDVAQWSADSILEHIAKGGVLSPSDALSALKAVTDYQRLANGQATGRLEIDLTGQSTEDLLALAAQMDAAAKDNSGT